MNNFKLAATVILCAASMMLCASVRAGAADDSPAYLNTNLPVDARVADLAGRMTMEEKVSLMHNTAWGIPRLNIKPYEVWNEALHGVARLGKFTVFPQAIAMASTWDPDLIFQEASAISDEAWGAINRETASKGFPPERYMTWWSPTINMARDPRWGRTPETYGEDPYLTGRIAVAFVRGMQGDDPRYIKVVSTPKHFAANNEEHNRLHGNAWISEKTLREYYFPAFKAAVQEGGAQSVMGSYNAVNGIPSNGNRWLLTDVLRNEWGFKGFVVTDCGAGEFMFTEHKYAKSREEAATFAIKAGVDIECGSDVIRKNALNAVKQGMLTEDEINIAATRLLTGRFRLGMFDPPEMIPYSKIPVSVIGSPAHIELARQVSRESIVLLKNDKVGGAALLPLNKDKIHSILVTGPNATALQFGDYSGTPFGVPVNGLDGITNKLGGKAAVSLLEWNGLPEVDDYRQAADGIFSVSGKSSESGLSAEYFNSKDFTGAAVASRVEQSVNLDASNLPAGVKTDGPVSVRWTGTLTPQVSGIYFFYVASRGDSEIIIEGKPATKFAPTEKKKSMLKSGAPMNVDAVAAKPPKRKSYPLILEAGKSYKIEIRSTSAKGAPFVRLDWVAPKQSREDAQKAVDAVYKSDAVVAFMGISQDDDREGHDRDSLDAPFGQDEFVGQLQQMNRNVIVVLINGSPLAINWMKQNVPAIVEAWYPGEQGGNAIADVLFGDYSPAGRLTMTNFKSVDDLPAFNDYEISHGRTYMYFDKEPLFPFGYGLSYTSFNYGSVKLSKDKVSAADTINVTFDVANTGGMDGDEVAQLYVRDVNPKVKRPIKRLRGFQRVRVKKGEKKTVTLPLAMKDIAYWNDLKRVFEVVPGTYELLIGASSADIRQKAVITVTE